MSGRVSHARYMRLPMSERYGLAFIFNLSSSVCASSNLINCTPGSNGVKHGFAFCCPIFLMMDSAYGQEVVVNTAAWIINRNSNSVTVKTPYEIVYQAKPQLKNMKVFGALGYAHIPDEKSRNFDAKAFKCRFLDNEDDVKGYRDKSSASEPQLTGRQIPVSQQIVPAQVEVADVIPLQRDTVTESAMVPYESTHPMITRSRARHIDETTDPEEAGARKKQVIDAPSTSGTKRQRMTQERSKPTGDQLAIEGGQAMAAMEGAPSRTKRLRQARTKVNGRKR
ncbi:unnamed protein product [Phytophthora lilii]|uniref:Unnamed protein product n=1 Tax=Phytophthora lilii TaxID=2077276 RepID=A0A9W6TLA9_9STRA|nr:unnamed protein product [Phytophthora lilii]